MKKLLGILLILTLVFSLASCDLVNKILGRDDNTTDNDNKDDNTDDKNNTTDDEGDKNEDKPGDNTGNENPDKPGDNTGNENPDKPDDKPTGEVKVMTYAEYVAANVDDKIIVDVYVQAHQSWWNDQITVYAADRDGAYFLYNMACSEADSAKLTPGTKIRVTGYKAVWEGEVEIVDATFEVIEGADTYVAPAKDLTSVLGTDSLIDYQNQLGLFKSLTIKSISYKNGTPGDDIYVTFTKDGADYSFCVEYYLTGSETDVYKAFETLVAGDVVDVEGFVYWYENVNTHITKITKVS